MRHLLLLAVLAATVLLLPGSASGATCAGHSTQAEAQRAADTRDADGDGIYCVISPH